MIELQLLAKIGNPFFVRSLLSRVLSRLRKPKTYLEKSTLVHTNLICDVRGRQFILEPLGTRDGVEDESADEYKIL